MENTFRSVKQLGPVLGPRLPAPWLSTWIHTPVGPLWPATSFWSRGGRPLAGKLAATPSLRNPHRLRRRAQNDPYRCTTSLKQSNTCKNPSQMAPLKQPNASPKSRKNRPKIEPKSLQNRSQIAPKSDPEATSLPRPFWDRFGAHFGPNLGPSWGPRSGHVGAMLAQKSIFGGPGWRSKTNMMLDAFRNRFLVDFGAILGSKIDPKSVQHRCQERSGHKNTRPRFHPQKP